MTYWGDPAVAALTASDEAHARRRHFKVLPYEARVAAIRRLSASGASEDTIARACGIAIEQVRRLITEVSA